MFSHFFLLAFSAFIAICAVDAQKARCGDSCKFRFCRADGMDTVFDQSGPRLQLRDPNVATNPFVCWRLGTGRIKVKKTGTVMVYDAADLGTKPEPFVQINKFRKNPKFPKKYIGLRSINKFPPIPDEKGIFRTKSGGKLEAASDNLCVKIPIKSYLDVDAGKTVKTRDPDDCISFRSRVPKMLLELTWDSSDDIDINVVEPNGNKIWFDNTKSNTGGRLILDQNVGRCGEDPDGREQITWLMDDSPLPGKYTVQVRHWRNCGNGPTKWNAAVIIGGELVTLESGTSDKDDDQLIKEFMYTFP